MPRLLKSYPFAEDDVDLPEVQAFFCGPNRWDVEVADWIKSRSGDNSVIEDMRQLRVEVWLHRTEEGELAGFSSLGENKWSWPPPKGPKHLINYIPFIGVAHPFQGEPKDADRDDKFAYLILDELIEYAAAKTAGRLKATATQSELTPVIGLSVDRENTRAIKFYMYRDFVDAKSPRTDKKTGIVYDRMFLNIADLVASPLLAPTAGPAVP